MKSLFYCFDQSDLQLMNDRDNVDFRYLSIEFNMPSGACKNDDEDMECVPIDKGFRRSMMKKQLVLLTNQRRFIQEKYDGNSPIVKESVLKKINWPNQPTHYDLSVSEIQLTREDNPLMSIYSVTEIEESAFSIDISG